MRRLFLIPFLILFLFPVSSIHVFAQTRFISGRVLDAETHAPLPGANVFVSGTTFGDATGEAGSFSVRVPDLEQFELVVSMIGYEVWQTTLNRVPAEPLTISLNPKTVQLQGIHVVAEQDRIWRRHLKRFETLIFNDTPFGNKCTIINPEVLDFEEDDASRKLKGSAREPLIIRNDALGYRIVFHNVQMQGDEYEVFWDGEAQFFELTPDSDRTMQRWLENRRKAYSGSLRHFLKSLYSASLKEEGFEAFFAEGVWNESRSRYTEIFEMQIADAGWDSTSVPARPILFPTDSDNLRLLSFNGVLQVRFNREAEPWEYHQWLIQRQYRAYDREKEPHQVSWLVQPGENTLIDSLGRQFNENALWRYGFLAWERVGEMLPSDFEPPDE